jgi:hypothetical protein
LQVIDPLRSRCLCVRVPAPTDGELRQVMEHVASLEGIALPEGLKTRIAQVLSPARPCLTPFSCAALLPAAAHLHTWSQQQVSACIAFWAQAKP